MGMLGLWILIEIYQKLELMNVPDKSNPVKMLIIALIIFVIIFIYLFNHQQPSQDMRWFIRVVMALAAAAMSMSLSGSIDIGTKEDKQTLAQKSPNITAAGAMAVFVLVYLFGPLN